MKRARQEGDFYPTPESLVETIVQTCLPTSLDGITILEPSAGDGAFVRALRDFGVLVAVEPQKALLEALHAISSGTENMAVFEGTIEAFAKEFPEPAYDVITGNPPYSLAEEHVRLCLKLLNTGGQLTFLLRNGFLAHRRALFEEHPPETVWMLQSRPSFCWSWSCPPPKSLDEDDMSAGGCGHKWTTVPGVTTKGAACPSCGRKKPKVSRSDSADYCVITWIQGYKGPTRLRWL